MFLQLNRCSTRLLSLILVAGYLLLGCALAQQSDSAQHGGVATIALPGEAQTLDMHITTAEVAGSISSHWLETLVAFDSNWSPQPHLAKDIKTSEDGMNYTFVLREGVKFHDGTDLTADDVVASLRRWTEVSPRGSNVRDYITSLEAVDDHTVELSLNAPFAPLLSLLAHHSGGAGIYPSEIIEKYGSDPIRDHIGTGPYEFVQWLPDRHVEVKRFDGYQALDTASDGYSGERVAYLDTIRFAVVPETATRIAGTQTGDYDYGWQIAPDAYAALEADTSVDTVIRKPFIWGVAFFNKRQGLMTNQKLRQAVNAALDMEELLIAAAGPEEFWNLEHNYMVGDTPFKTEAGADQYNQADPERARQLAEEAGYDGQPIRWLVSPDYNQHYLMSLAAEQQLEAAGFNIELMAVEWGTLLDIRSQEGAWDVFVTHHGFAPDPVLVNTLSSTYPGWWDEERRSELVDRVHTATSLEERQAAWDDLLAYNYEYLPSMMLGELYGLDIKSPDFQPGEAATQGMPSYWNSWKEQ
ncbi:MAG: ABC transporter substrate-binding protein [Trueperaceae bacterium]